MYYRRVKENHHFIVKMYDHEGGKYIGKTPWHGQEIQSEDSRDKIEETILRELSHRTEKIKIPKIHKEKILVKEKENENIGVKIKNWKIEGFSSPSGGKSEFDVNSYGEMGNHKIPGGTRFTGYNTRYPFEYIIKMKMYQDDDPTLIVEKIVSVVGNGPMTRKEIKAELKEIIRENKADSKYLNSLKSFRVISLMLNRYATYQYSYKVK
jgi:hypothetical protein